jgi:ATP-binding cassette, subfamily B, bacterial
MKDFYRLLSLWRIYWKWLLVSVLLTIGTALGMLAVPALSEELINSGIMTQDFNVILKYGGYMLLAAFVAGACQAANALIAVKFSERTAEYLRNEAYSKVQEFSFGNLDRLRPSDLLVRLTTDVQNIKIAVQQGILNLLFSPIILIVAIGYIALTSPSLLGLMAGLLVICVILLGIYLIVVMPQYNLRQVKYDHLNRNLQENMAGVRVVKAFVRQDLEKEKFGKGAAEVRDASVRAQHYVALLIPTMIFVVVMALALVYFVGGSQVMEGKGFSLGEVTAAVQYLFLMIMPFMILGAVLPAISSARPSLKRLFEVIDAEPEIRDKEGAITLDPPVVTGRIVFEDVDFGYRGPGGQPGPLVLKNINLSIAPGEIIGILGPTGSGKTSLISLVPRFYDVTKGRVLIDGVDVRDISQDSLRRCIGICLQQPNLFSGTIRENILFGADDQSDDNMRAAARDADAEGFIENIPKNYDDSVSRRGTNFSGGQRQRISIARTLATKPRILILDDSTSACDVATEARIQDAIAKRFPVTRLIVAQRISSVIAADRILLLENGGIAAIGTHEELLKTSTGYREIYDSQLGSGILAGGEHR